MFVVMTVGATEAEILGVKSRILAEGLTPYDHVGAERTVIHALFDDDVARSRIGLEPRFQIGEARGRIVDVERGPERMPDSRRIVYVRNEKKAFHPIHVVDVDTRASTWLRTGTKINHDVTCARDGTIAFRAQVDQWDQIFIARLKEAP